jgi:hypothetical protein
MPVAHLTLHAFGTWTEDHPRGYVQRGQGLQPPSPRLHRARRALQTQPPARFDRAHHRLLGDTMRATLDHRGLRPHGLAITPNHLHLIFSFPEPQCTCPSPGYVTGAASGDSSRSYPCRRGCPARVHAEAAAGRIKKDAGYALARAADTRGHKVFSRGWDLSPVRSAPHLDHLLQVYLPRHRTQGGTVTIF